MTTKNPNTTYYQHFGSIAECDALRDAPWKVKANGERARDYFDTNHGGTSWYGVADVTAARRAVAEGHPAGALEIDTLYEGMAATLPRALDHRRKLRRGDQGDSLDIHAVNRGDLARAWTTAKREIRFGSGLIRVAVDVCGNAGESAQSLRWRGVAALALSRSLTKAGYSVEIVAGMATHGSAPGAERRNVLTTVTVKPRHVATDTALLAGVLCLSGFFRIFGFAAICRGADSQGVNVAGGLGHAVPLGNDLAAPEKVTQIITPHNLYSADCVKAWVIKAHALLQHSTIGKG